jgi:stage II sporulation protein AA (anti-sigma F factor antagonist)
MLEVIPIPNPGFLHLLFRGQVTTASAPQLEQALIAALDGQVKPLCVLDLGELTYTSSAGLRVLLVIAKRIRNSAGRLVLCRPQPAVLTVFEVSGFTRILEFVPDVAAARDRLLSA